MTRTGVVDDDDCPSADDMAALLEARLDSASLHALEQHLAACVECRKLVSTLASALTLPPRAGERGEPGGDAALAGTVPSNEPGRELPPGTHVGRYVVMTQLGAGAMGTVYEAHDPELDRKVALKILRHSGRARGERDLLRDRLRHEAQAMAQLAHPNVVTLYDVGTVGDDIFIAMELVEGTTLAAWLATPRSWRAVVAVFVSAGQGLAAAHTAGLVHRDFKPENVLVGNDGRVRVGDFGLARMVAPERSEDGERAPSAWAESSGRTTALVGTPYYMAPEQLHCRATDARSDQFSFCVALYSAIVREHPFDRDGVDGLVGAVTSGRLCRPPPRSALPRWLLRVLQRGLATDPTDRHPSMNALLAELRKDPGRRRLQALIAAVIVVVLVGGGVLIARGSEARLLCNAAEQKWQGAWDAPRAQVVARAFGATGKPYAGAAYAAVARTLDAYRNSWIAMHTEACEATHVRGEQSEDLLQRRMLCLDARLRDARALTDRFAAADADTVEHAPLAVGSLGELASCADAQALSLQVPPPADRITRARVAGLRAELAELKAQRMAGRARDSRGKIGPLITVIRALHYRPLEAEALQEQGDVELDAGDLAMAEQIYEQAVWAAEAGRDDELAASAWTRLMQVRGSRARYDEGLAATSRITALLERLGGNDELEGNLHVARAAILTAANRIDEARSEAEKARAFLERRFGEDDLHVANADEQLAAVADLAGHTDEALAHFRHALSIKRRVLGGDHPAVAAVLSRMSFAETVNGHYQDALVTLGQAQAIYERAVDPDHPALADLAHRFGVTYAALGELSKAIEMNRRAVAIGAVAYGTDHPRYASFLMDLGDTLEGVARHGEAMAALQQALAVLEKRLGAVHVRVAVCLEYITRVLYAEAKYPKARETVTREIAIYEKLLGSTHANLRPALLQLGKIELKLGAPARALAPLERAYAFGPERDRGTYSEIQWALGRALVEAHRDDARGLELIRAAQDEFEGDARERDELRELQDWRRRRR